MPTKEQLWIAFKHYLLGVLIASWNGGIGALAGILGIDSVSISGMSTEARILNAHEMMAAFCGAFVISGIFWLKSHPIPEKWNTAAPFVQQKQ